MDLLSLDLETVLRAEETMPGAIIKKDGLNYVSLEFLCSVIEQTVEVNKEREGEEKEERLMQCVLGGLLATMSWAPQLLQHMVFQDQLSDM